MFVFVLASTSRMAFTNLLRSALRERGYVEADGQMRDLLAVSIWAHREQVACEFNTAWLGRELLRALADDAVEARGSSVEIMSNVENATMWTVSGGEVDEVDVMSTALEWLHDWTDGGPLYDPEGAEQWIAHGLLDVEEQSGGAPELEELVFWRDPEAAAAAAQRAKERERARVEAEERAKSSPTMSSVWRRFVHPDGRRWAIRLRSDGFDLEITDADGDVFKRSRQHASPRAEVALLVTEQLNAGFVDENG